MQERPSHGGDRVDIDVGHRSPGRNVPGHVRIGTVRVLGVFAILSATLQRNTGRQCGKFPLRKLLSKCAAAIREFDSQSRLSGVPTDWNGQAIDTAAEQFIVSTIGQRPVARGS